MELLIVGTLDGQIGAASKIAIEQGGQVSLAPTVEKALEVLRSGKSIELVMIDVKLDIHKLISSLEQERINVLVVACGVANDTVAIEQEYISYTFQTNMYYLEKYGEKDPNFENYVEYMLDSSLQDVFTTGIEETKVGDYEALKYIYNGVNYVLNVDGLPAKFSVSVIPLTEDADLEALAADPEINSIINSIKVEALNN